MGTFYLLLLQLGGGQAPTTATPTIFRYFHFPAVRWVVAPGPASRYTFVHAPAPREILVSRQAGG